MHGNPAEWDAGGPHAVTIGVFDGVHRGHRFLIDETRKGADRLGIPAGLITFDRHPLTVLAPEHAPPLLTSLGRRLELFEAAGLDTVGVLPFGDSVRSLSAEDFIMHVIVMGFGARLVVVGEDFRFAKDRAGNIEVLQLMGDEVGFDVEPLSLLTGDGPLSSSRVRALVAAGDVEAVADALGRPFELRGRVARQGGQGGRIGIPTADLIVSQGLAVPGRGVYAVRATLKGHDSLPGVVYIGGRPTFGGTREVIHFHLLDAEMELDGASIYLQFIGRVRDEQRFGGPADLAAGIAGDLDEARRLLG
jgi:riboflavin kinase/FMN adenylyltransferase